MLDTTTKKRIDDCRDILVGKLPDPKAQIEQITIGLIYKFMDDMDKEAVELGGQAKFFSDYKVPDPEFPNDRTKDKVVEFSKYAWDNLLHPKVTAAEMLTLYAEAIVGMEKNPNIPQLFRDIFKNAFLPYRDPETLKLFLKTIGEFEYTHSEKLGDAFEYLLSVMGSQGDAGQFRTPRHIIDFLVAMVDPKKTDTILDPACGTAGFLISAFKHIKAQNYHKLTPDEQKRLIQNFVGYDISPDMVRLSLVNLYLHGFANPHISEYDTLSSEERWNETYDVILANPPFMSPKGGIRPHKKFSISSNRSEVLFVDYIAEHLNQKGRAGIIVPEGVIFQSGTAYKHLRKMLVENYLYAVVSLPAGVFNPYSGVKTSILLMDAAFAKTCKEILFVKIDNDGYGLGAQRNAVKGGQLNDAIEIIRDFYCNDHGDGVGDDVGDGNGGDGDGRDAKFCVSTTTPTTPTKLTTTKTPTIAHTVQKSEIAKNGDYNLSGERYKNTDHFKMSNVEIVKLNDISEIEYGYTDTAKDEGDARFIRITDINEFGQLRMDSPKYINLDKEAEKYILNKNDILVARTGATFGKTLLYDYDEKAVFASFLIRIKLNTKKILPKYYWAFAQSDIYWNQANNLVTGGGQPQFNGNALKQIQIPLPPLSVQEEIVAEIEGYQKIIDGAKMVVENYKPKIDIDADWEMVAMSEIADVNPESKDPSSLFLDWFTYIDISSVENGSGIIDYSNRINITDAPSRARRVVQKNDILLSTVRPNLKAFGFVDREPERFIASTGFALLRTNQKCESKYLYYLVFQDFMLNQMVGSMEKGAYPSINQNDVNNLKVALAPIEIQHQIVSRIEKEQELVNANKQLIEIFEQKIKDRIAKVWGENKTDKKQVDSNRKNIAAEPKTEYKTK